MKHLFIKSLKLSFVLSGIAISLATAQAQIQIAGDLLVDIDATSLTAGPFSTITNTGSLGGNFQGRLANGNLAATGTITNIGGANGVQLLAAYCMQLINSSGALIAPPSGLVGSNATASIEVWALNPGVADDECMVSWGKRGVNGQNMAFEYGNNATFGAVVHTGPTDMQWDVYTGAPLSGYWHHLVYTFDGINQSIYKDGALVGSRPVAINIATNAGIMLGAQWTNNATSISTTPALANLVLSRVRIHDEALTASQIEANFATEKSVFIPAPVTPQFLTVAPIHRYSFNEPATNDATGLEIRDSIGTAHGIVRGTNILSTGQFSRGRLILPASETISAGGIRNGPQSFAAYGDLPNGLLSNNSTNNGGTGEVSIEVWYKNLGGVNSARVFDIGSCGTLGSPGLEVPDIGGRPSTDVGLDYLFYSSTVGANWNQRRLSYQNKDSLPAGSTTNAVAPSSDITTMGSHQTDRHVVVTWNESTGQLTSYENGIQGGTIILSNSISSINDVNVWLGRSVHTDAAFAGEFDEVRFYTNILSLAQVVGNFQVGPDTLNTAEQPVALLAEPKSVTLFQGASVSFHAAASGSPAVSYQWNRNTSPIANATNQTFSISTVTVADNGDFYSCTVSNFANSASHVLTTTNATLTVMASLAPATQFLHETRDGTRDNYNTGTTGGEVGGLFLSGNNPVTVTHLGYYDQNKDGLNVDHIVAIFNSAGIMLTSVVVPAGTGAYLTNGYRWAALNPPYTLNSNTIYNLQGQVISGSGDGWPDVYIPGSWNPYFVGTNGPATRQARFSGVWGANPSSTSSLNGSYGAPNLAVLPIGAPTVATLQSNVTTYAGSNITFSVFVNGESPVTVQWYKAPGTLLTGQTNLTLTLSGLTEANSGDYYVVASNPNAGSPTQSANITLDVLANTAPIITAQPISQTVYVHQQTTFSVTAIGRQPLSYEWSHGTNVITDATNSILIVKDASAAKAGNYSVKITNTLGTTNSESASLTVLNLEPASYASVVLDAQPLVYYRFSEVADTNVAFNLGSLGIANDGLYEGSYSAAAGPQPPAFPNFESTNQAVFMDRDGFGVSSADVRIPPLNLSTNMSAYCTLAAWIYSGGPQAANSGIIFNRGGAGANGIGVTPVGGVDSIQ